MTAVLFWIFALAACGGAIAVVIERNVVRMAFWLVVSLGSVAGLFFLLAADFVGATQLLVYVGGTVVLLIFGVMLTATGPLSLLTNIRKSERLLAGVIGASLLSVISVSALAINEDSKLLSVPGNNRFADGDTTRPLGLMLLGLDGDNIGSNTTEHAGYLLPFEIASMHLLVVLIGAAYLARAKRRQSS